MVAIRVDDRHLPSAPWHILRSRSRLNSTAADFPMFASSGETTEPCGVLVPETHELENLVSVSSDET
jgi:hypothetical protein